MPNLPPMIWNSLVGWSGNSNNSVQRSDQAKLASDDMELPLECTQFTPTYRATEFWTKPKLNCPVQIDQPPALN